MIDFDDDVLENLVSIFGEDQINELIDGDLTKYQEDPLGFFQNVLKMEFVPPDLIKIAESIRDNKITVCQSATGTGKTYLAASAALWHYKCFPKSQTIVVAAPPESNLKEKAWSEITEMVIKNKKLFKNDKVLTLKITDDIDLKNNKDDDAASGKHFIVGKTIPTSGSSEEREAKFSGQHADFLFFINDESDAIPDEVFRGEDGCLSGDGSRQLNLFNPKRKSGWVYDLIKNGRANVIIMSAFNHPNVITGNNIIPGAVSRDKTIERIWDWTEPLKEGEEEDINCFVVPEFLVDCTAISPSGKEYPPLTGGVRRITNPAFFYKVLGVYPTSNANTLFNEQDIDNAFTRWKLFKAEYGDKATEGIRPVLGMDVSDEGSDNCCVAKKYGNFMDEVKIGRDIWRGVDVDLSADKLAKCYAEAHGLQANVEADGIGAAIPPKVSRMFYWKCENIECQKVGKTYSEQDITKCPICQKEMVRQHFCIKKVYVSAPSEKKCDIGKFGTVRDELIWKVAEWLKKEPSAMLFPDPELKEQMMAYEYYEDQNSGKIKVSDKKTIKKKLRGKSDDKFAAVRQCFYEPKKPSIRILD